MSEFGSAEFIARDGYISAHLGDQVQTADNLAGPKWFATAFADLAAMSTELHRTEVTSAKLEALHVAALSRTEDANHPQSATIRQQAWYMQNVRRAARHAMLAGASTPRTRSTSRRHQRVHQQVVKQYLERTAALLVRNAKGSA